MRSPRQAEPVRQLEKPVSTKVEMALRLQRTIGNTAFVRLLQRDASLGWDLNKPHKDFARTHHTDPNRTVKKGSVTLRNVLLQGLKHGFQGKETADKVVAAAGESVEDAAGKAVVWMLNAIKPKESIEVLLHLHGFGSGYRELAESKTDYGGVLEKNQTRDEDLYQLPDQLAASMQTAGRQVIAVLPQGRARGSGSMFGDIASNPTGYLDEVFKALKDQKIISDVPSNFHVVVSGHSGAGPEELEATQALEKRSGGATASGGVTELVMFDSINGPNELKNVKNWLEAHIKQDVAVLGTKPSHTDAELKTHFEGRPRFRGYFTQGAYEPFYGDKKDGLRKWLTEHLNSEGGKLDAKAQKWLDWQYHVFGPIGPAPTEKEPFGPHEHLLSGKNDPRKAGLLDEVLDTTAGPP